MITDGQQGSGDNTDAGSAKPTGDTTAVDDVQTKIDAAIKAQSEVFKKEIQGLNRRNSELEKTVQEKELEKLTEQERAKKEIEIAKAEKEKILSETVQLKRQSAVVGKGLDPEFANLISGSTDDEINQGVATVISHIEKEVAKRMELERNKAFGGQAPIAGKTPTSKIMTLADFNNMGDKERAAFMANGGTLKEV